MKSILFRKIKCNPILFFCCYFVVAISEETKFRKKNGPKLERESEGERERERETDDRSVLDAEMGERVGGANVKRGERSAYDSKQQSQIRPLDVLRQRREERRHRFILCLHHHD
ncbi:hypothetical protein C1H46_032912 [Malus baccata]|uniref:Uncharacterized protein n=1 Tax=Malus baccata TaxID=106549 RepID=A0A540L4Z2_MALBA|nr:hypothetical protein C1H46_032912 [Malus baccata]